MSDSSIFGWMQTHERRFMGKQTGVDPALQAGTKATNGIQNPQKSLDAFLKPPAALSEELDDSTLFDDEFSLSDFRSATQSWKEKNTIAS
jgi:hypothetical protein